MIHIYNILQIKTPLSFPDFTSCLFQCFFLMSLSLQRTTECCFLQNKYVSIHWEEECARWMLEHSCSWKDSSHCTIRELKYQSPFLFLSNTHQDVFWCVIHLPAKETYIRAFLRCNLLKIKVSASCCLSRLC